MKKKHKKCLNCKHAGTQFKLGGLTHLHCEHPKNDEAFKRGKDKADGDMLLYIETIHSVVKGYEIDIKSLINRYNKNTKRHGN